MYPELTISAVIHIPTVPQQPNVTDCGLYLLAAIDWTVCTPNSLSTLQNRKSVEIFTVPKIVTHTHTAHLSQHNDISQLRRTMIAVFTELQPVPPFIMRDTPILQVEPSRRYGFVSVPCSLFSGKNWAG